MISALAFGIYVAATQTNTKQNTTNENVQAIEANALSNEAIFEKFEIIGDDVTVISRKTILNAVLLSFKQEDGQENSWIYIPTPEQTTQSELENAEINSDTITDLVETPIQNIIIIEYNDGNGYSSNITYVPAGENRSEFIQGGAILDTDLEHIQYFTLEQIEQFDDAQAN